VISWGSGGRHERRDDEVKPYAVSTGANSS
jgi:hypothetical protein